MNGILVIDKPAGMTSHDVVYRVRKAAGQKRVGHAGTLDPDATGVLLVCIGHAARLSDLLADQGKEYLATARFGQSTTTEDSSGEITSEIDPSSITERALKELLPQFIGTVQQVPPMVSALHHNGHRLYELARRGIMVERQARAIEIQSIDVLDFTPGPECTATLRVSCGKGAYIRTLCSDLGDDLGVGGHMASLRRTRVGRFDLAMSVPLAELNAENVQTNLVSATDAVSFLPAMLLDSSQASDVLNGKQIDSEVAFEEGALVRLVFGCELVALGRSVSESAIQPEKVFPPG